MISILPPEAYFHLNSLLGKKWFELQSAPSYTHISNQESKHCVPPQWSAGNQQKGSGQNK